jgi:hypothetical protein
MGPEDISYLLVRMVHVIKAIHASNSVNEYTAYVMDSELSADDTVYNFIVLYCTVSGPGSAVSIGTGYGLDGLGIESRWGRDFPKMFRPALGTTQPPVQWITGLSRG